MTNTPHTPRPDNTTQAKLWLDNDVLAFVDEYATTYERSRSYVISKALKAWQSKLVRDRQNSKARRKR